MYGAEKKRFNDIYAKDIIVLKCLSIPSQMPRLTFVDY